MGTLLHEKDFPILVRRDECVALGLGSQASLVDLSNAEWEQVSLQSIEFLRKCFTKPPVNYCEKEISDSVSWLCKAMTDDMYLFRLSNRTSGTVSSFYARCCVSANVPDPNELHRTILLFQNWRSLS